MKGCPGSVLPVGNGGDGKLADMGGAAKTKNGLNFHAQATRMIIAKLQKVVQKSLQICSPLLDRLIRNLHTALRDKIQVELEVQTVPNTDLFAPADTSTSISLPSDIKNGPTVVSSQLIDCTAWDPFHFHSFLTLALSTLQDSLSRTSPLSILPRITADIQWIPLILPYTSVSILLYQAGNRQGERIQCARTYK